MTVIDWKSQRNNNKTISIISFIEQNDTVIKKSFIELIKDFKKINLKSKNLSESYKYRGDFDLWEMSLINEKNLFKTPEILEVLKILALEKYLNDNLITKIKIVNAPNKAINSLINYCKIKKVSINNKKVIAFKFQFPIIKASTWLVLTYLKSIFYSKNNKNFNNSSIYFFGYLNKDDYKRLRSGMFKSEFWGGFLNIFEDKNLNFIHISNKSIFNISNLSLLKNINRSFSSNHKFHDENISLKILYTVFKSYFKLNYSNFQIINKIKNHSKLKYGFDLSVLLKDALTSSLYGVNLINNILLCELFDDKLKNLSNNKIGFYLMENQSWELALVNSWKRNCLGKLIAVQHTFVSFWDFKFSNTYDQIEKKYSPDYFIVNSTLAKNIFLDYGYGADKIIEGEAHRYLYLNKFKENDPSTFNNILILGSINKTSTNLLLNEVSQISNQINSKIYFRPHPSSSFNSLNKSFILAEGKIGDIQNNISTVICTSDTAACLDFLYMKKKIIIHLNDYELNISPLRNIKNIHFTYSSKDILNSITQNHNFSDNNLNFFNLDPKLSQIRQFVNKLL
jgi:surface carbohydrate biosynthesis protein (TIGR04326 family)